MNEGQLREALVKDPTDVAARMAWADVCADEGRAEFVRLSVWLGLEGYEPECPVTGHGWIVKGAERDVRWQEAQRLYCEHGRGWLQDDVVGWAVATYPHTFKAHAYVTGAEVAWRNGFPEWLLAGLAIWETHHKDIIGTWPIQRVELSVRKDWLAEREGGFVRGLGGGWVRDLRRDRTREGTLAFLAKRYWPAVTFTFK